MAIPGITGYLKWPITTDIAVPRHLGYVGDSCTIILCPMPLLYGHTWQQRIGVFNISVLPSSGLSGFCKQDLVFSNTSELGMESNNVVSE